MPHLRLVIDEPEIDPPAPLPIRDWRRTDTTGVVDVIDQVEQAFGRVQQSIDSLSEQLDDLEPLPFPRRKDHDDDGPWAA